MNIHKPIKSQRKILLIIIGLISMSLWYIILRYVHLDYSTTQNALHSYSVWYLAIGSSLIAILLACYSWPLANIALQVLVLIYIANFGILFTMIKISKAQVGCYTAQDILHSNYCLLLLKPPSATVYRALNPKNATSNPASPSNHQGHRCQINGATSGSAIVYDASADFYDSSGSSWQSIHSAVINFTSGLSISSGQIAVDVPLCASVTVGARDNNNFITLTDTAATPSPTATPNLHPGDANNDGRVDGLDYIIWLNHYNLTTTRGYIDADFNNDRVVNGVDYVIWLNNYHP